MDDLMARCIAHIQSIIDQLYVDLDAIPEGTDTTPIREAIRRFEDTLHQCEK